MNEISFFTFLNPAAPRCNVHVRMCVHLCKAPSQSNVFLLHIDHIDHSEISLKSQST